MAASPVQIPTSNSTVSVSIIDTTSWAYKIPCGDLFRPRFIGLDAFDICSYAFLVKHQDRRLLFDLGIKKDWEQLVPDTVARLRKSGTHVTVEREIADILRDGGTEPDQIEAVIWSHIHWDHTGNLASFPPATKLIVGPGIIDRFMPGWPTVPDSHFRETDVAGREIVGLEGDKFTAKIGGFSAHDYFGDGSFYILDAPGHSLGHLNALARTSVDPETFIFLAADSVHLAGEFRPTELLPLPDAVDVPGIVPCPCPAEHLLRIHPRESKTLPYLGLDPCFPEDLEAAEKTIENIQAFDADERVFVVWAHDVTLHNILEYYPATADDWKVKGWKETSRRTFLSDLQEIARKRDKKGERELGDL
ncbi:beta-lactamase-like protein [Rhypophila decipiens]